MSVTTDPTTADRNAAPDWATITHDVLCPLCDYNLRGLTEPRCPECGAGFDWSNVTDPQKRVHPYLFEHHPERNIRSFVRTLIGTLRPGRFWASLSPGQAVRPGRMVTYWVVTTLLASLAFWAEWARAIAEWWNDQLRFGGQWVGGEENFWVILLRGIRFTLDEVGSPWGDVPWLTRMLWLVALWVAWPWLTLMALRVFQASMRRAKVKNVHVLRCVVYTFDAGVWLALAAVAWAAYSIATLDPRSWPTDESAEIRTLAALSVMLATVLVRLWIAYRRYMRFDHAFWTVAASKVIVALFVLNFVFLATDWAWRVFF